MLLWNALVEKWPLQKSGAGCGEFHLGSVLSSTLPWCLTWLNCKTLQIIRRSGPYVINLFLAVISYGRKLQTNICSFFFQCYKKNWSVTYNHLSVGYWQILTNQKAVFFYKLHVTDLYIGWASKPRFSVHSFHQKCKMIINYKL